MHGNGDVHENGHRKPLSTADVSIFMYVCVFLCM